MYVCGITPYDATHMGHAASYVAFDLLNRAWRDGRQQVSYVQNVTDVDDPLLERATATGVDWRDLAASQIELFQTDMEALNVLAPDHYVGAVEAIPLIVPAIERLRGAGSGLPGGRQRRRAGRGRLLRRRSGGQALRRGHGRLDPRRRLRTVRRRDARAFCRTRRRSRPGRQTPGAGPAALARCPRGRTELARRRAGGGPARLAHRMHGHRAEVPARPVHRAGRRLGPDLPAPRNGRRACLLPVRRAAGAPLLPRRHGGARRRENEQVQGKPGPGLQTPRRRRGPGRDPAGHPGPPLPQRLVLDRGRVRPGQGKAPHLAGCPRRRARRLSRRAGVPAAGRTLERSERPRGCRRRG